MTTKSKIVKLCESLFYGIFIVTAINIFVFICLSCIITWFNFAIRFPETASAVDVILTLFRSELVIISVWVIIACLIGIIVGIKKKLVKK